VRPTPVTLLLPAAIVVCLFARAAPHPFIAYDDTKFLLENPQVVDPRLSLAQLLTPTVGYIVPVTIAVEAVLYRIGDGNALPFHLLGILLHVTATLGVARLARRCCGDARVAAGSALLFALHPLVVEPVCWASGLKDLLMANLALVATRLFIELAESGERDRRHAPAFTAVLLATLGCLSKPTAVFLGLSWLAYIASRRAAGKSFERRAAVVAAVVLLLGCAIGAASRISHDEILVGEDRPAFDLATVFWAVGLQSAHVVWPMSLAPAYPLPIEGSSSVPLIGLGVAVVAALLAALIAARRQPFVVLGLTMAIGSYLPVSGILPFNRVVADSYMYLPLASTAIVAAIAIALLQARAGSSPRLAAGLAVGGVLALASVLGVVTHRQITRWGEGSRLWNEEVDSHPTWDRGRILLADELVYSGHAASAADEFRTVFRRHYYPNELTRFGIALGMAGRLDDAECVLIEAALFDADRSRALQNYAIALSQDPDRTPVYPEMAAVLLPQFVQRLEAGAVSFPPQLRLGLAAQRRRASTAPAAPPGWVKGSCGAYGR
jgi:hypothetical protein